jgi:hypothetical protein
MYCDLRAYFYLKKIFGSPFVILFGKSKGKETDCEDPEGSRGIALIFL